MGWREELAEEIDRLISEQVEALKGRLSAWEAVEDGERARQIDKLFKQLIGDGFSEPVAEPVDGDGGRLKPVGDSP